MEICFTNVYFLFLFMFGQLLKSLNHFKLEVGLQANFVGERALQRALKGLIVGLQQNKFSVLPKIQSKNLRQKIKLKPLSYLLLLKTIEGRSFG